MNSAYLALCYHYHCDELSKYLCVPVVCDGVCVCVCLCKRTDNEGNHYSSISSVITNTVSLGDFCSVIHGVVMTDMRSTVYHRLWKHLKASGQTK